MQKENNKDYLITEAKNQKKNWNKNHLEISLQCFPAPTIVFNANKMCLLIYIF